jgi:hypothetical protein
LLDGDGSVIADAVAVPAGIPEVRGAGDLPAAGARIAPADAAGVVPAMPEALRARVAAIDLTDGVRLLLHGGGEVRLCDTTELAAKGAAAVAVMERLGATPFIYIDVCVPRAPVSA